MKNKEGIKKVTKIRDDKFLDLIRQLKSDVPNELIPVKHRIYLEIIVQLGLKLEFGYYKEDQYNVYFFQKKDLSDPFAKTKFQNIYKELGKWCHPHNMKLSDDKIVEYENKIADFCKGFIDYDIIKQQINIKKANTTSKTENKTTIELIVDEKEMTIISALNDEVKPNEKNTIDEKEITTISALNDEVKPIEKNTKKGLLSNLIELWITSENEFKRLAKEDMAREESMIKEGFIKPDNYIRRPRGFLSVGSTKMEEYHKKIKEREIWNKEWKKRIEMKKRSPLN